MKKKKWNLYTSCAWHARANP